MSVSDLPSNPSIAMAVQPPGAVQQDATPCNNKKNERATATHKVHEDNDLAMRQENAIALLLQGLSDAEVGAQLGVDRSTVFRWRKDDNFAAEFERRRQAILERRETRIQSMLDPALEIVQKQLTGDDPKTALRAAALLLRIASPSRIRTPNPQPAPDPKPKPHSSHFDKMMAFIDAPLPDDPTYAAYMARLRDEYVDTDAEDSDDDE